MNISYRQLSLFESVVRNASLSKAADERAISQSAASQAIQELERQLGYPLFRKVGRRLVLTDTGEQVLPKIRGVLAGIESLRVPDGQALAGRLRICASETIASYLLPELIAGFVEQHPQVDISLDIRNTETTVTHIEQGQASIGFIEGPATSTSVQVVEWRKDEVVLFANTGSEWLQASNVESLPFIVREKGSGTRAVFDEFFKVQSAEPLIRLQLTRQEAIKHSVRAGLGVGCLSRLAIEDELQSGMVSEINIKARLERELSIVRPKASEISVLVKAFLSYVQQ